LVWEIGCWINIELFKINDLFTCLYVVLCVDIARRIFDA
jgi:hypothetical protein